MASLEAEQEMAEKIMDDPLMRDSILTILQDPDRDSGDRADSLLMLIARTYIQGWRSGEEYLQRILKSGGEHV